MPSFSSSEISSMISSKKYKVKKGDDRTSECREGHGCPRATDSLSILADKFQDAFPCAKSANKSSLMDKIYNMNKSAFGGSKDLLFEGKDLDLKFICEYRNNLKFDKSKKEYTFTNAQRCWIRNSNRLKPQDFLKDKLADQTVKCFSTRLLSGTILSNSIEISASP